MLWERSHLVFVSSRCAVRSEQFLRARNTPIAQVLLMVCVLKETCSNPRHRKGEEKLTFETDDPVLLTETTAVWRNALKLWYAILF